MMTQLDPGAELLGGTTVFVQHGTKWGTSTWTQTVPNVTIGTTAQAWVISAGPNSDLVHIDGTETISGPKTFSALATFTNQILAGPEITIGPIPGNYASLNLEGPASGGGGRINYSDNGTPTWTHYTLQGDPSTLFQLFPGVAREHCAVEADC